jgi:hypothetical protein
MGVRTSVPQLGRFLQPDPVQGGSANDYDYTNQDPVNTVDLDGRCICLLLIPLGEAGGPAAIAAGATLTGTIAGVVVRHARETSRQKGGSGNPRRHFVRHPTKKRAKDAARGRGDGAPKHGKAKDGNPAHCHSTRNGTQFDGRREGGVHHWYGLGIK